MIEALLSTPKGLALVVAMAVGLTHYIGHSAAGDESKFDDAGVMAAGIAVMMGAGIATYIILTRPGVSIV